MILSKLFSFISFDALSNEDDKQLVISFLTEHAMPGFSTATILQSLLSQLPFNML